MNNIFIFTTALFLGSIGHLATDIYLPSMPSMAEYFAVTSTEVQLTLSAYMLSFCLTPIIAGPISDKIGRKHPMLWGAVIAIFATILCVFSKDIYFLIFARFLQGIGLGLLVCVSRAILPDHFQGKNLAKYYSYLTMFMPVVLAVGPILGALIYHFSSWHGIFVFMLGYLIIVALLIYYFFKDKPLETKTESSGAGNVINIKSLLQSYIVLLKNKNFLLYSFCSIFIFIGIVAYLTVHAFLFQDRFAFSPLDTAITSMFFSACVFIAGYINTKLITIYKAKNILWVANVFVLLAGAILLYTELSFHLNIYILIFSILLFFITIPSMFANAHAKSLANIQGNFGAAMALMSSLQFLGGSLVSALLSFADPNSAIPLAIVYLLVGSGCFLMLLLEKDKLSHTIAVKN